MKPNEERHYHQAVSLSFKEKDMLKDICKKTNLNTSEVVRELIRKAYNDEKTQWIIQQQYLQRHINGKSLRIMSNASTKKDEPTHHRAGSTAVSLNNRDHDNTEEVSDEEVDAAIASLDDEEESLDDMLKRIFGDKYEKFDQSRRPNR